MIAVIGLGFVGLSTALGIAHITQKKVYAYDIDLKKQEMLKDGKIPFYEPYLEDYLKQYVGNKFIICDDLEQAITNADIIFYCVGTPSKDNGESNLDMLIDVLNDSLKIINKDEYKTLVIKSTVPPATTQEIISHCIMNNGFEIGKDIGLANNPEFLREGYAWKDFINPDRIIIGEYNSASGQYVAEVYREFGVDIYRVSLNTAEFIKYLSNTLLATLISFSNEMSMIAGHIKNIDIKQAFEILHQDKRWSGTPASMSHYVYPGCGFGGYCLPKDTSALVNASKKKEYMPSLINEVLSVNEKIKEHFVRKILSMSDRHENIGILGLAFKPESDDVRGTTSEYIINALIQNGYNNIIAYDPLAIESFKKAYQFPVDYVNTFEEVISTCDTIIIVTAWKEFTLKQYLLEDKTIIDGRYCL